MSAYAYSYLISRWHRTKINSAFSSWEELAQRFPQGSALGSFLFNIYLNDLFYLSECTKVCNFAGDSNFYACNKDLSSLINRLEHDSLLAIEWIENSLSAIEWIENNHYKTKPRKVPYLGINKPKLLTDWS